MRAVLRRATALRGASAFSSFFFNDTATTEIYTLSLHDALPISPGRVRTLRCAACSWRAGCCARSRTRRTRSARSAPRNRSEEHTSELQSQSNLVCRLLLEKKKKQRMEAKPTTPACHQEITSLYL